MDRTSKVLALYSSGLPDKWISLEHAVEYYAKQRVAWEYGEHSYTMRGGIQKLSGQVSEVTAKSVIAIHGNFTGTSAVFNKTPQISRSLIFARDHHMCAYCGYTFVERDLELEHVVPVAQGGPNTWLNLVTSCYNCNDYKGNRTPEQASMELLYKPYIPNRAEVLILLNPRILTDQREYLNSMSKGNFTSFPRIPTQRR